MVVLIKIDFFILPLLDAEGNFHSLQIDLQLYTLISISRMFRFANFNNFLNLDELKIILF